VSRQYERTYLGYYDILITGRSWSVGANYYPGSYLTDWMRVITTVTGYWSAIGGRRDPHLRSCNAVKGYHIKRATVRSVTSKVLVDDLTWSIWY